MLFSHVVSSPDQKLEVFSQFQDRETLWVVNDLESKFWVQDYLRETTGPILHTDRIFRASEFWQKLLLSIEPRWQVLPTAFAELLMEQWMSELLQKESYQLSAKDKTRAYKTIGQILPLLSHFQGEEALLEWFSEKEDAKERWHDWYRMGQALWERFSFHYKIPQEWMKAILINLEPPPVEAQTLLFDLSLDIDDIESELILNLSRHYDVHLIVPSTERDKDIYRPLVQTSQLQEYRAESGACEKTFKKFPSMLAEVKEAVFQVRQWLDSGLQCSDVAIVSPQIENYWPTLSEHLLIEGIPVNKNIMTPLSQFPLYQKWLSQLRVMISQVQSGDGETLVFMEATHPSLDYREYSSLFTHIYQSEDFLRHDLLKNDLPPFHDPQKLLSFDHFMEISQSFLSEKDKAGLQKLWSDMDAVHELNESLKLEQWVDFFETYMAQTDDKLVEGDPAGIAVLPLKAALNPTLKKVIVLGLSEKGLTETESTALSWPDIESIKLNFGFNLPHADRHRSLDVLSWFEQKNVSQRIYLYSETDFSGQYQAPALFWLQGALSENVEMQSPGLTRWDQLQRQNIQGSTSPSSEYEKRRWTFIDRDKGQSDFAKVPVSHLTLSASSLEEYDQCPFKFFARKYLRLDENPALDLDLDPMGRGQLLHKICEEIVAKKLFSLTEPECVSLVERCRTEIDISLYTDSVWEFLKPFYVHFAKRFIQNEVHWRESYPKTQTWAVEEPIRTHICRDGETILFNQDEGIPFRGVIDRIDHNQKGEMVLIDYKSSGGKLTQYGSWLKNGKVQLTLYAMALLEGPLREEEVEVVGAFYYVLKDFDRSKGFAISECDPELIPPKKMSREQRDQLMSDTKKIIAELILQMEEGFFQPHPRGGDLKICENCQWNSICRYPELNH